MRVNGQQFLLVYSSVLSAVLGTVLLTGAKPPKTQTFDEIQVHRINVVEPNGTLRMVISNHAKLPGVIVKGNERPPSDRPQAGMIFYNDEGSENGGLIFGGRRNEKGEVVDSGGSLSFDKYGADEIVQLAGVDDKNDRFAGLAVSDRNRRIWVGRTRASHSLTTRVRLFKSYHPTLHVRRRPPVTRCRLATTDHVEDV